MAHYTGALLLLGLVAAAVIVTFVVARPFLRSARDARQRPEVAPGEPPAARTPPQRRATDASPDNVVAHPTLMHAALSTHLTAVSGTRVPAGAHRAGAAQAAGLAASVSAQHAAARLVSIRRPARIPRRPVHRCPHKP